MDWSTVHGSYINSLDRHIDPSMRITARIPKIFCHVRERESRGRLFKVRYRYIPALTCTCYIYYHTMRMRVSGAAQETSDYSQEA